MGLSGQEPFDEAHTRALVAAHAGSEGPLLPILNAVQESYGHVPEAAVAVIADGLNLSRADVWGVVTFYHDYRRAPPGRHVVKLCRAEACQASGGSELIVHAERRLGVRMGETARDGAVTLEAVYCLGLCACGPAALIDGRPVGRLSAAAFDALAAEMEQ